MGWLNLLTETPRKSLKICSQSLAVIWQKDLEGLGNAQNVFSIDSGADSYETPQLDITWYHRGYHHQKALYHHKSCVPQSQPKAKYKQKKLNVFEEDVFYWELFCRLVLKTMSGRKNLWWNRLWHLVSRGHCNVWVCPSQLLLVWWFSNVSILTMMIMLQHKCNPEIPIGFYYPSICNQSSSAVSRLGQENQNQNTESCIKLCLWAVRRPKAENDDPRPFSWLKIEKEVSKEIL